MSVNGIALNYSDGIEISQMNKAKMAKSGVAGATLVGLHQISLIGELREISIWLVGAFQLLWL